MRVLSISPELPSPGKAGTMAATARQIESLRRLGVEMRVLDMKGIPKLKYAIALPRIQRQLRHVDLVHAHFGFCGWLARLQWRKPIVMSFMGSDLLGDPNADGSIQWLSRMMIPPNRRLARLVRSVIVKSEEMARIISPVKVHVIPNGVDLDVFQPRDKTAARRELGWALDGRSVLFPGNPDNPRKNFPLARAAVQAASAQLGSPIEIKVLKGVAPDSVAKYMNACDAMLMTSLKEGSPNVVKEAMASNLPVAGVPVGDVEQLLTGVPGYKLCPRDAAQLGGQLTELMTLPGDMVRGRDAIQRRGLDLNGVAQRVLDVYEQALRRRGGRSAREEDSHRQLTACLM